MADYTLSRLGQINQSGSTTALFLKVFSGEVLNSFNAANIMMSRHLVRSIKSGKSAQFPAIGTTTAGYHTPGAELTGNAISHAEKTINIDNLLVAHTSVYKLDEAMNHYEVRGEYAKQLGEALSNEADRNILQVGLLNARTSATITGGNGGSALTNAGYATTGSTLASGIFKAAEILDQKNVPPGDRSAFMLPLYYYTLAQTTSILNKDWGGSGAYADGTVLRIAGIELVKTNNMPAGVISAKTGENNTYSGTFTNTVALVQQRMAIGTVKLLDLAMEQEYSVSRQGTLMVAKYAMGHGGLRPECGIEIKAA